MTTSTKTEEQAPYIEVDAWFENTPLFIAHTGYKELSEQIKEHGCWYYENDEVHNIVPQIFYVLAMHKKIIKTQNATTNSTSSTIERKPRLLKVVTNLIGNSVTVVEDNSVDLEDLEEKAFFSLPQIPYELVNDIDDFFRKVFIDKRTEAIVIFTYDVAYLESKEPSDGWGILVPDQKNTAHSCDYDPQSIIDDLPDDADVRLVGTAHSHPNMDAYCSGVDKRDQSEFDGIHITYGWKPGSTTTDYYIELQMGGTAFVMQPDQVFKDKPKAIENPKIEPWLTKVSTKSSTTSHKANTPKVTYPGGSQSGSTTGYDYGHNSWFQKSIDERFPGLPKGCPLPTEVTLVAAPLLTKKELKECPACEVILSDKEIDCAKCLRCRIYFMWVDMEGDGVKGIIEQRKKSGLTSTELDLDTALKPSKPIWIWEETVGINNKIEEDVYSIHPGTGTNKEKEIAKK